MVGEACIFAVIWPPSSAGVNGAAFKAGAAPQQQCLCLSIYRGKKRKTWIQAWAGLANPSNTVQPSKELVNGSAIGAQERDLQALPQLCDASDFCVGNSQLIGNANGLTFPQQPCENPKHTFPDTPPK